MSNFVADSNVKAASFSGVVIRCGCNDAQKKDPMWHGLHNIPCNNPKETTDLGTMAFYSKNPLKMLLWKTKKLLQKINKRVIVQSL